MVAKFSRGEEDRRVRDEIMSAVDAEDDPKTRKILLFLVRMQEDIGQRLDRLFSNEAAIREMVLNGHATVHHDDHEWIAEQRAGDKERIKVCEWAKTKMEREAMAAEEDIKNAVATKHRHIERALWLAVSLVLAYLGLRG